MSIIITLAGGIAFYQLPMAQFPQITPPTVQVDCNYPGANAQTVAENIAAPIEQEVNGVENMLYMASQSTSDGSYTLTVTFRLGVDLDQAQVMLQQNRVDLAMPRLPEVVQATGVTTRKRSSRNLVDHQHVFARPLQDHAQRAREPARRRHARGAVIAAFNPAGRRFFPTKSTFSKNWARFSTTIKSSNGVNNCWLKRSRCATSSFT